MIPARLPYPGLRAFTREESDLFFGRDGCVDAMVDRLASTRFLAVLGPSGGGKSSLVRTGLLDALDLGLHPWAGSRWQVADLHPGGQPIRNLAMALLMASGTSNAAEGEFLRSFLQHGPRSVVEWAAGGNLEPDSNLLILVDQFEELFRYGDYAAREEAEAFVSLLLESAACSNVRIHVVITMRSEYLGAAALIPGLAERINSGLYLAPRMSREECGEAIQGPASLMEACVEPALVNRLLNDLASFAPWESTQSTDQLERLSRRADQLPLMQHVLNRLWMYVAFETADVQVVLRLSDYERIGDLSGALEAHGSEVMAALGKREQYVEPIFRALMSGTSAALAVRRPCRIDELLQIVDGSRDDVIAVIEAFRAPGCNFLRTSDSTTANDDTIVDISHESLIRQWAPLKKWLEREVRDGNAWRRLVEAQERHARCEGGLLTGLDLQTITAWWQSEQPARQWTLRHGGEFESVRAFFEQSLSNEEARIGEQRRQEVRERRRLRGGIAVLAVALVVVTGLGIYASIQGRIAEENAGKTLAVLEEVGSTIYSDRFASLVGMAPLQSDLMEKLLPYQVEIEKRYAVVVDPANVIRNKHRLAMALNSIGRADQAMINYREAYQRGISALQTNRNGDKPPQALEASFIDVGSSYAWWLLDVGEYKRADEVLNAMREVAGQYDRPSPTAALSLAYASLENLLSRRASDRKEESAEERHNLKAIELLRPIAEKTDATMETLSFQVTLYENLDNKQDENRARVCALADRMLARSPMDRRAIRARVACLKDNARSARATNGRQAAMDHLQSASELVRNVLRLVPDDQSLLLALTDIETDIVGLSWGDGMESQRSQHNLLAGKHFVDALKGRTLLQDTTNQVQTLYEALDKGNFSSPAEELAFFKDITTAMEPTLKAFPHARSFANVSADAASHVGEILKKNPESHREAQAYLSKSIDSYARSGLMDDLTIHSDGFATYCGVYASRAAMHGAAGNVDSMLADGQKLVQACKPALDRYPWDFYLRQHFVRNASQIGAVLVERRRYREALPHLEYASHWGDKASSERLVRVYREGLDVPRDEQKARELDAKSKRQGMKRITVTADFGGVTAPFHIYLTNWPPEYPFEGVDDQLKWLSEARGGTVAPQIGESFRKLHKIARENDVSFTDLCAYALGLAAEQDNAMP
jgi:tetratricopeptide (TPR) repeat protein